MLDQDLQQERDLQYSFEDRECPHAGAWSLRTGFAA